MKKIAIIINDLIEKPSKQLVDSINQQKNKDFNVYAFNPHEDVLDLNVLWYDKNLSESENLNLCIKNIKEDYFMVISGLENINIMYIENAVHHLNAYPSVSAFLPIIIHMNENNEFLRFSNEFIWTRYTPKKSGFADFNLFKEYNFANFNCAIIKRQDFLDSGALKPSFKYSTWYEFFLRLTNKGNDVMVIPRYGVAITETMRSIDKKEYDFYEKLAKKEYFFTEDRNITYDPSVYNEI